MTTGDAPCLLGSRSGVQMLIEPPHRFDERVRLGRRKRREVSAIEDVDLAHRHSDGFECLPHQCRVILSVMRLTVGMTRAGSASGARPGRLLAIERWACRARPRQ
jgi:hypothetical protein